MTCHKTMCKILIVNNYKKFIARHYLMWGIWWRIIWFINLFTSCGGNIPNLSKSRQFNRNWTTFFLHFRKTGLPFWRLGKIVLIFLMWLPKHFIWWGILNSMVPHACTVCGRVFLSKCSHAQTSHAHLLHFFYIPYATSYEEASLMAPKIITLWAKALLHHGEWFKIVECWQLGGVGFGVSFHVGHSPTRF